MSIIIHITYMSSPTCPVYHLTRNITRGDTHGGDTHHLHDVVYLFSSQDVTQIDTHHLHDMSERVDDVSTWSHASITTYAWQDQTHCHLYFLIGVMTWFIGITLIHSRLYLTVVSTNHTDTLSSLSLHPHVSISLSTCLDTRDLNDMTYTWQDKTHYYLYLLLVLSCVCSDGWDGICI